MPAAIHTIVIMTFFIDASCCSLLSSGPKELKASPRRNENAGMTRPISTAQKCPKTSMNISQRVATLSILVNGTDCAALVD